jgi:hypothetical protein
MSNVKNSYNGIRRIRKGYKLERLNRFVLMRPLRNIAKAITDEYIIESPIFKKWTRKIIFILLFFNLIYLTLTSASLRAEVTNYIY